MKSILEAVQELRNRVESWKKMDIHDGSGGAEYHYGSKKIMEQYGLTEEEMTDLYNQTKKEDIE